MKLYLETEDFSVTGEKFQLLHDEELDMLVTSPKPENLEKYYDSPSYISHSDANKTFAEKLYQTIKSISLRIKLSTISTYAQKDHTLLDVGAGTGDFLLHAQNKGWEVNGVEPNTNARAKAQEKNIVLYPTLDHVPKESFKIITLWHVLEHLPDFHADLKKIHGLLKKDGTLVIAVPNFKSYDAQYYQEFWAAYDVPRHLWHFSAASIIKILGQHGFKLVKKNPMWFDAFYVSLLSEKYKTGKQNFLKALALGIRSNAKGWVRGEFSSAIYILQKEQNS